MLVWRSTFERMMDNANRTVASKEQGRLKAIQELEQLKIVHRLDVKAMEDLRNERDALKSQLDAVNTYTTDCRSEDGVTVGLVDAMISISRVLNKRDVSGLAVQEALADFRDDEDRLGIVEKAFTAKRIIS